MGTDTAGWVRALRLDEIWEGEVVPVTVDGEALIVAHLDGGHISAFLSACPHQGSSLDDAHVDDGVLVCPAHQWEFDLRSGHGINPSRACLTARPVRVEDDAVWIGRPANHREEGAADGR
ncbi:MAG: Rieske 2Fe-2S domain-containing protein [Solirubrobacteraceae bacterium]